jgi:death-on-curing protein
VRPPRWVSLQMVLAIHDEALYYFGGSAGLRDVTLLESALDKPKNKLVYEPASTMFDLAAVLGTGIARNHAFVDGNKRTALLATRAFLFLNGRILEPREEDEVLTMLGVATGEVGDGEFAAWFEANCVKPRVRARPRARHKSTTYPPRERGR